MMIDFCGTDAAETVFKVNIVRTKEVPELRCLVEASRLSLSSQYLSPMSS